jgi:cysteine-S-conjugate beta-lyase
MALVKQGGECKVDESKTEERACEERTLNKRTLAEDTLQDSIDLSPFDRNTERANSLSRKYSMCAGEDLFAAGVADMDFAVADPILGALHARLGHPVFGYERLADGLLPALTRWLAERHRWAVSPSSVVCVSNVVHLLVMAISLFTAEGDSVIVQPPVYNRFFDVVRANGRRLLTSALVLEHGRYRMDFADLEAMASQPTARLLLLCNPHNPVGRVWSADELRKVGDICARHGVLVVSDEIHGDIVFRGHHYTPFASLGPAYARNCVACTSPAKTFNLASCSFAFAVVQDSQKRAALLAECDRLLANKNPNAFASAAMEAAYRAGGAWLEGVLTYLQRNVSVVDAYLREHLPRVRMIQPEGTFLVWLDFRRLDLDAAALHTLLREHAKWVVSPGPSYGAEGCGFARVNIACPTVRLLRALRSLDAAVQRCCTMSEPAVH